MKGGINIESVYIDNNVLEGSLYKYKVVVTYADGTAEEIEQVRKIEPSVSMFDFSLFSKDEILKIHRLASEKVLTLENCQELISVLEQSTLNVNTLDMAGEVILDYMNILSDLINDLNLQLKDEYDSNGVLQESIKEQNQEKKQKQSLMIEELLRYIYLFEMRENGSNT